MSMLLFHSAALAALLLVIAPKTSHAVVDGQFVVDSYGSARRTDRNAMRAVRSDAGRSPSTEKHLIRDASRAPPVDVHAKAKEAYQSVPPFIVVMMSMITSGLIVLLALKIGAYMSSPVPKGGESELEEALKEAREKADMLSQQLQEEQQALRQAEIEERGALAAERIAQGFSEVQGADDDLQTVGASALETAKLANEKAAVSIKLAMKAQDVLHAEMDCIRSRAQVFADDEKRGLVVRMNDVMESIQEQTPDAITSAMQLNQGWAVEVVMVTFTILSINFTNMDDLMKAELKARIEAGIAAGVAGVSPGQVTASLRDGSVRVIARLEAPGGAETLKVTVKSSTTLRSTIIEHVNSVPNIATVTFGELTPKSISTISAKTGAEFQDGFELPPIATLIAGAMAPSRLRSLHDSTFTSMIYHFLIAAVGGTCLFVDWNVPCTQARLKKWMIAIVVAQVLSFFACFLLRLWSGRALTEMYEVATELETEQTTGVGGATITEMLSLMQDFRKSFAPYSYAMNKYDDIVSTWAYFLSRISGLILLGIGITGVVIAINDVLLDEDFCNMRHVLKFVDVYSFLFLFFLTWQLLWLVHWLLNVALGCGSTWATQFVIKTAQSLDKDVPMNLPIFTSIAQSFVFRDSSQQFRLQEEQFEDEVTRLERKLASLQEDLAQKQERMRVLDRLKNDRKQLANLDDPLALTANLKDAMTEVEPVVIFAASLTADNLQQIADTATAATEELQRAAAEAAADARVAEAALVGQEALRVAAAAEAAIAEAHAAAPSRGDDGGDQMF